MSVMMLLVLSLVTIGVILGLAQLSSKARWTLLILGAVVGLPLMVILLSHRRMEHAVDVRAPHMPIFEETTEDADFAKRDGGSAWWPEAVETLHAECYPTSTEAAQALARSVARRLQNGVDSDAKQINVHVAGQRIPEKK